jgi:NhaP-type Na+/H+ or K+/H+ antiporter
MIYLCLFSTVVYYSNNAMCDWLTSLGYRDDMSWSITNVIHIAVILVSTDTIAPLSLIDGEKYPNLFAIVFGEGVSNDAVSLIAFNTMVQLGDKLQGYVNSPSVGLVFLTFLKCGVFSILFGAGMSMVSAYFHKNMRSLQGHPFIETLMVILFAMINYFLCELSCINLSGIVSIFVFGILQSHYNFFNLSKEAQDKTESILDILSYTAEAMIFVYLGLSLGRYDIGFREIMYALVIFATSFLGRFCVTFLLYPVIKWATGDASNLKPKDIFLISLSGMIRGAIALGLVEKLNYTESTSKLIPIVQ